MSDNRWKKARTFNYDEKGQFSPECQGYMESLSIEGNSFPCPYLRILPEDIKLRKGSRSYKYAKGSLHCTEKPKFGNSRRCHLGAMSADPRINAEGNLEFTCEWPAGKRFEIKLSK